MIYLKEKYFDTLAEERASWEGMTGIVQPVPERFKQKEILDPNPKAVSVVEIKGKIGVNWPRFQ